MRHLSPFPCKRARGCAPRSKCSHRRSATSCTRPPELYSISKRAWSRWANRPSVGSSRKSVAISSWSRKRVSGGGTRLLGMGATCCATARHSGTRSPQKLKERMQDRQPVVACPPVIVADVFEVLKEPQDAVECESVKGDLGEPTR